MDFAAVTQAWFSVIVIIFIISFLHSENPLYRIAEHIFVGAAVGHATVIGIGSVYSIAAVRISSVSVAYVLPVFLGILLFATFSKKYYWLSRYGVALLVGTGTGLALATTPRAQVLDLISPSFSIVAKTTFATFNNILVLIGISTSIAYFIFTRDVKGHLLTVTKWGRYFMMAAFGAGFGGIVMSRLAIFVPTMQFLVSDEGVYASVVGTVLVVVVLTYQYMNGKRRMS